VKIIRDNKWLETFSLLGETNLLFSNDILFRGVFFIADNRKQQMISDATQKIVTDNFFESTLKYFISYNRKHTALALFPLHVTLPNTPISVKN